MSRVLQKDAEQESQMRAEIQDMKQELSTVNMMDEFARYARLERRINKMTDKLKTHVKARTAQLAKIKWVISVAFYVLQPVGKREHLIHTWYFVGVPVRVTGGHAVCGGGRARPLSGRGAHRPHEAQPRERQLLEGCPDGVAHLEVLLCPCGRGAEQVDNSAGPPGGLPYQSSRRRRHHLLDFSLQQSRGHRAAPLQLRARRVRLDAANGGFSLIRKQRNCNAPAGTGASCCAAQSDTNRRRVCVFLPPFKMSCVGRAFVSYYLLIRSC
ncbi:tail-anchored protein insertion receptor WRB isoform X2 [Suricata suricatta]|nr:tail-anchored protein insertion receptor WRB isoform X2 [Suricata suricatta]XP_029794785.1 tail-anchored protein insertion receptor WRB isoform X2 [Suricata suricatta]XP_029794786.1 tail-anchored protein insertion receptor WRB isoform X2 [Suricata suricatta]